LIFYFWYKEIDKNYQNLSYIFKLLIITMTIFVNYWEYIFGLIFFGLKKLKVFFQFVFISINSKLLFQNLNLGYIK